MKSIHQRTKLSSRPAIRLVVVALELISHTQRTVNGKRAQAQRSTSQSEHKITPQEISGWIRALDLGKLNVDLFLYAMTSMQRQRRRALIKMLITPGGCKAAAAAAARSILGDFLSRWPIVALLVCRHSTKTNWPPSHRSMVFSARSAQQLTNTHYLLSSCAPARVQFSSMEHPSSSSLLHSNCDL